MIPGMYWAKVKQDGKWVIVEVLERTPYVLYRGFAVRRDTYSAFVGPLPAPPSDNATPAWTVPSTLRIRAQVGE